MSFNSQLSFGVSSALIISGTITNANISPSAGISTSKISGLATSATTDTTNATNISSGALAASRMPAFTGDITTSAGAIATTLATVNSNVGTFGSSTLVPVITVNAKGLVTGVTTSSISGALTFTGDVTGSGTTGSNTALSITALAVTNAMLAGSIANAKLVNSSVTVGTTAIALGASSTTLVGLTSVTSTSFTGALTGNASTATTLETARAIQGVNFDGSAAITVVTAGTGVSVSGTAVSIGQAVGTTDNVTFNNVTVSGTLTSDDITSTNISVAGNATITGNLTVSGTTTTINSTVIAIADLNLELARNATTAAAANGAGITVTGPVTPATFTYTSADDRWNLNKNLNVTTVFGALSGNASTATALATGRTIAVTGDITYTSGSFDGTGNVTGAATLATVNANVGAFGSSTLVPVITVNAKGLVTAVSTASISGSISVTGGDLTLSGTTGTAITNATLATVNANVGTFTKLTVNAKGLVTAASAATTTDIGEGTNLYYTDTRARAAHSFTAGSGAYNSSTGVITIPTNNNQLTNGAGYITGYTEVDTLATVTGRGATTTIASTFNGGITVKDSMSASTTNAGGNFNLFSNLTGFQSLTIAGGNLITGTDKYVYVGTGTNHASSTTTVEISSSTSGSLTKVWSPLTVVGTITGSNLSGTNTGDNAGVTSVSGTAPVVSSGGTTPAISMAAATTSVAGYLTAADWTTFNNKQPAGSYLTDAMRDRGGTTTTTVDTATLSGHYYQANVGDSHSLLVINTGGSTGIVQQRFHYSGSMEFRNKTDSANWNGWKTVLHSSNYNSYSPTLTGTGASGTWGINVTGTSGSISGFNNPTTAPTVNTIVYRDSAGDISAREIVLSSGLSAQTPTVLVSMYPTTNQMVRTTPAAVAAALSGQTMNISGNASTASGQQASTQFTVNTGGAGYGLTGVYNPAAYQSVWSMGPAYVLTADGTTGTNGGGGNMYGMFYTHDYTSSYKNVTGLSYRHGVGHMEAGVANWFLGCDGVWFKNALYVGGIGTSAASFRAPIFYDSNDTGYYVNPNATSNFSSLYVDSYFSLYTGAASGSHGYAGRFVSSQSAASNFIPLNFASTLGNHSWGIIARFRIDGSGQDRPSIQFSSGSSDNRWNIGYNTGSDDNFRLTQNMGYRNDNATTDGWGTVRLEVNTSGNFYSYVDTRSPIFYDSNDTGYYVDPNGRSNLYNLTLANSNEFLVLGNADVSTTNKVGLSWGGGTSVSYSIFKPSGAWIQPLYIAFHTGLKIGAQSGYGGTRFYNTELMATEIFSVGNGDDHVRVAQIGFAGTSFRAPIFYDLDDTGYYTSPNSFSQMSYGNFNAAPSGRTLSLGGDQTDRVYNDGARSSLVINATYYPHLYINATSGGNTNHGAVFSMTGNLTGGGYRRWGMGIANLDPDCWSWGYADNNPNPHYGVGGGFGYTGTNSKMWLNTSGSLMTTGDMRAPIFYDSDNTAYYVDPAASQSANFAGHVWIGSTAFANPGGWNKTLTLDGTNHARIRLKASAYGAYAANETYLWLDNTVTPNSGIVAPNVFYLNASYTQMANSARAPIFYDLDNTGYYLDPASTSNLNAINSSDIYNSAWFRNTGNQGVYNSTYGTHFYSDNNYTWVITGSGGNVRLQLRSNHQSTVRGHVYADTSNNIGFLTNDENWGLRVDSSKNIFTYGTDLTVGNSTSSNIYMTDTDETTRRIHCNSNRIGFLNSANNWSAYSSNNGDWTTDYIGYAGASMRAPLFYDNNDTSYYVDAASTSELSALSNGTKARAGMNIHHYNRQAATGDTNYWVGSQGWGGTYNLDSCFVNLGSCFFDHWGATAHPRGSVHCQGLQVLHYRRGDIAYGFQLVDGGDGNSRLFTRAAWGGGGGTWYELALRNYNVGGDFYASIYYDSDNTAYYLDPNSTGTSLNVAGAIIAAGNITAYSDIRLKEDIEVITDAIDKVKQITGITYTRKENGKRQTGVIAQDVLKVLPEAVEGSNDSMYSVAYGNMVGLLVEAIKEQQIQIEELKTEMKAMKNKSSL